MPIRITLHIDNLFDGLILPKPEDTDNQVQFYEIGLISKQPAPITFGVIAISKPDLKNDLETGKNRKPTMHHRKTTAIANAHKLKTDEHEVDPPQEYKGKNMEIEVFLENELLPSKYIKRFWSSSVMRVPDGCEEFTMHIYKIVKNDQDRVGVLSRIGENSSTQDAPIFDPFNVKLGNFNMQRSKYFDIWFERVPGKRGGTSIISAPKAVGEIEVDNTNKVWQSQREFYTLMQCSSNRFQEGICAHILYEQVFKIFIELNREIDNILDFCKLFAKAIFENNFTYKPDVKFNKTNTFADYGDASLELTGVGDCEDYAHLFIRILRMAMRVVDLLPDTNNYKLIRKNLNELKQYYIPFVHICQITIAGVPAYHATPLFVPREDTPNLAAFNVELTSLNESFTIYQSEYKTWHKEHYFLVTPFHVFKIPSEFLHELPVPWNLDIMFMNPLKIINY